MKKFVIAMALGATVAAAGSASAAEQRPSYIAFKPSNSASVAQGAAPAGPSVAKRSNLKDAVLIPIAVVAIGGGIALAVSGGGSDGSPN